MVSGHHHVPVAKLRPAPPLPQGLRDLLRISEQAACSHDQPVHLELPNPLLRVKFFASTKISRLAKDFFNKLCSYPASERYDAQKAL